MKHSSFNYVRTYRQRHALTTEELAFLINQRSETAISLFETGDRMPTLEGALALQVVFGIEPRVLFSSYFEQIEDAVMRRAQALHDELDEKSDQRSGAKRQLLEAMAARHGTNTEAV